MSSQQKSCGKDWFIETLQPENSSPDIEFGRWIQDFLESKTKMRIDIKVEQYTGTAERMFKALKSDGWETEIALDLCLLAFYDMTVLLDDSISMKKNRKRIDVMQKTLSRVLSVYELANPKGIAVRFLNSARFKDDFKRKDLKDLEKLANSWQGLYTRIGQSLQSKVLDKLFGVNGRSLRNRKKPLLVIVITDGDIEAEKQGYLEKVMENAYRTLDRSSEFGPHGLSIQFAYVGDDTQAKRFLERIRGSDAKPSSYWEYISCLVRDKLDKLEDVRESDESRRFFLASLLLGSILRRWDSVNDPYRITPENVFLPVNFSDARYWVEDE